MAPLFQQITIYLSVYIISFSLLKILKCWLILLKSYYTNFSWKLLQPIIIAFNGYFIRNLRTPN